MIVVDPEILSGTEPVVEGTRFPARDVAAEFAAGTSLEEVLASHPSITAEQVDEAVRYVRENSTHVKNPALWLAAFC